MCALLIRTSALARSRTLHLSPDSRTAWRIDQRLVRARSRLDLHLLHPCKEVQRAILLFRRPITVAWLFPAAGWGDAGCSTARPGSSGNCDRCSRGFGWSRAYSYSRAAVRSCRRGQSREPKVAAEAPQPDRVHSLRSEPRTGGDRHHQAESVGNGGRPAYLVRFDGHRGELPVSVFPGLPSVKLD